MKKLLLTTAFFSVLFLAKAQTVTTFTEGTPDDAIAVDASGNIYCSNYVGDTVFKFTPTGEMTPFITGLNTPNGLAFNDNQELFVCDGQGNTIYKYDLDGNEIASYSAPGHPSGIVKSFDDDSMIFTLYQTNEIKRLAADGTITDVSLAAELNGPVGIVYDDNGNLFIGNYNNRAIYKVEENGDLTYIAQLPTEGGTYPNLGFITYGDGKLWGTVMGNHEIFTINPEGVDDYTLFAGSDQGGEDGDISNATFNIPNGIYYDANSDNLLVTDFGSKNLRIISGIVLSTSELKKNDIAILPNPAKDYFRIVTNSEEFLSVKLSVFNALGVLVYQNDNVSAHQQIDVSSWAKGHYFVKIQNEAGTFFKQIVH